MQIHLNAGGFFFFRYAQFQEAVAKTTEIAAGEQLILFHNRELSEIIEGTIQMQNWPKNLIRGQVYLYQREKLDQQRLVLPEIRKTRDTYVIMTSLLCFRLDYLLTKLLSCLMHTILSNMDLIDCVQNALFSIKR